MLCRLYETLIRGLYVRDVSMSFGKLKKEKLISYLRKLYQHTEEMGSNLLFCSFKEVKVHYTFKIHLEKEIAT